VSYFTSDIIFFKAPSYNQSALTVRFLASRPIGLATTMRCHLSSAAGSANASPRPIKYRAESLRIERRLAYAARRACPENGK
jgi:hypothetical protein